MSNAVNMNENEARYQPVFDGIGVADASARLKNIVNRTPLSLQS